MWKGFTLSPTLGVSCLLSGVGDGRPASTLAAEPPGTTTAASSSASLKSFSAAAGITRQQQREEDVCELCDTPFTQWLQHTQLVGHRARVAVSKAFVKPEHTAALLSEIQQHIGLDFSVVDAANQTKVKRRQGRLLSSLTFLRTQGILTASLLHVVDGSTTPEAPAAEAEHYTVASHFLSRAIVGESFAREWFTDRFARLAPQASGSELQDVVSYLLLSRQWSALFNQLALMPLVVSAADSSVPPPPLTQDEKTMALLSLLGELHLFTQGSRSHGSVTNNKAVTTHLVHHVLASHCVEGLLSESLHGTLERLVEECTPVWRSFQAAEQRRICSAFQSHPRALSSTPTRKEDTTVASSFKASAATASDQLRQSFLATQGYLEKDASDDSSIKDSSHSAGVSLEVTTREGRRGPWQAIQRQLIHERPASPAGAPSIAVAAPILPRFQRKAWNQA